MNIQLKEQLLKKIPEDFKKQIEELSFIESLESGLILIFRLKRDQYIKFKALSESIIGENPEILSIYAEHKNVYKHIGGQPSIKDNINGYDYFVTPYSIIKNKGQVSLYRKLRELCPKGKTRNAIIIGTHSGLIPMHIAHLYNRIYCIEKNKTKYIEAKNNIKINKINNCLLINEEADPWIKDFDNYKYTVPGRKHRIGLFIADPNLMSVESFLKIVIIEPETIILISSKPIEKEHLKITKDAGYSVMIEIDMADFFVTKIRKVLADEPTKEI